MANEQNLKPIQKGELTSEEAKKRGTNGGIKSGEARRQKKTMRETLEQMLNEVAKIEGNTDKLTYKELATLGLLKGAVMGNNANYKTILETIGELTTDGSITTPTLKIEVIDNSNLEAKMYEENKHNENDNG